jgi:hypothetical protein
MYGNAHGMVCGLEDVVTLVRHVLNMSKGATPLLHNRDHGRSKISEEDARKLFVRL